MAGRGRALLQGWAREGAARRLSRLRAVWPQDGLVARTSAPLEQPRRRSARGAELRQALDSSPSSVAPRACGWCSASRTASTGEAAGGAAGHPPAAAREALGDLPGAAESLEAVVILIVSDGPWLAAAAA